MSLHELSFFVSEIQCSNLRLLKAAYNHIVNLSFIAFIDYKLSRNSILRTYKNYFYF